MVVTTEVAPGCAARASSFVFLPVRTCLITPRPRNISLFRFSRPAFDSSCVFSVFCELFATFCSAGPLFSILSELFCAKQGVSGVVHQTSTDLGHRWSKSLNAAAKPQASTVAPKQSGTPCAATAASERRPCGPAKGWNSTLRYWPRPRGASSSHRMLSPPVQSRHCF